MENNFYLVNKITKNSILFIFKNFSACVLTVQLNELVLNGQLQEYSIIRLDRYLRSDLKGQTAKYFVKKNLIIQKKTKEFFY